MKHHILLVDDERDVLLVLEDLFTSRGYHVTTASDGTEALERLKNESPDLILSDYRMNEMDGITLLKETRDVCPDAIRILLTAHGDLKLAMQAINEASVYKFITKPWNNNDLALSVQRALEHYDLIVQQRAFAETLELMVDENTEEIERLRLALREMVSRIRSLLP
ncbi:MAG: response regulator [Candidatus Latescibacteria bacterium]|jgi:two-component system, probable response regulator PhcQ|nr:response regulator [Candidatus Latescibacterota bacterium]